MHRIIVEEKRWLSEQRFLHALNYCMLLPGPEAQQLATYLGWLMHRTGGGLIAGGLLILPGMICIMALSYVYALWGQVPVVTALLFGLKAAVLAIVVEAVIRIGNRSLRSPALNALAATAFIGIFFFAVPFPVIILTAVLLGLMGLVRASPISHGASTTNSVSNEPILFGDEPTQSERPSIARMVRVAAIWLSLRLRGRKSLRALRALDLSPAMFLSSQNATLRR